MGEKPIVSKIVAALFIWLYRTGSVLLMTRSQKKSYLEEMNQTFIAQCDAKESILALSQVFVKGFLNLTEESLAEHVVEVTKLGQRIRKAIYPALYHAPIAIVLIVLVSVVITIGNLLQVSPIILGISVAFLLIVGFLIMYLRALQDTITFQRETIAYRQHSHMLFDMMLDKLAEGVEQDEE